MEVVHSRPVEAAFAQPLTEQLLARSGITPGMCVIVAGHGLADLALLVAERVGPRGVVIGIHEDPRVVADAQRRASHECFDQVGFRTESIDCLRLDEHADAVVGRFFLAYERDPVHAIRRASELVRDGGRLVFQEWHYDSIAWPQTSAWPRVPLYQEFVTWSIEGLRRKRAHADMGLRLVNAFVEAGLPVPEVCTDLSVVSGDCLRGYAFFEESLRSLFPVVGENGHLPSMDADVDSFAERLRHATNAVSGHVFLPLQVGAWIRL